MKLHLPDEIILHIMSYLPLSCLIRFKCVCKLWNTMFLHPHLYYLHSFHDFWSDPDHRYMTYLTFCDSNYTPIHKSIQGLELEQARNPRELKRYRVLCPDLCQRLDIPSPQNPSLCIALEFVAAAAAAAAVKLVSVHEDIEQNLGYEILSLGIGSYPTTYCWRAVKVPPPKHPNSATRKKIRFFFRMGVAYCIWYVETEDDDVDIEVDILDMVNETYVGHTTFPRGRGFFSKLSSTNLFDWNGRLSFAQLVKNELHIVVLDDYRKLKWAERKRIIKLTFLKPDHDELITFNICADKSVLLFRMREKRLDCKYDINTGELTTSSLMRDFQARYSDEDSMTSIASEVAHMRFFNQAFSRN